MNRKDNVINLAFAFNHKYLVPFYVTLTSIFASNGSNRFNIHIIASSISEQQRQEMQVFAHTCGSQVTFYEIDEDYVNSFATSVNSRYGTTIYYRLFLSELVMEEKLLYLDTDVIVQNDLRDLYSLNIGNHPVAAAPDGPACARPELGISEEDSYFNSGVMLIHTRNWKKQRVTERATQFLAEFPTKAVYPEQDALNYVLKNNWYQLDVKYNLTFRDIPLIQGGYDAFLEGKTIIHFNHAFKPWSVICHHPLKYVFNNHFLQFIRSPMGELLRTTNLDLNFTQLIVENSEALGDGTTVAFLLHAGWIKALNHCCPTVIASRVARAYYSPVEMLSNNCEDSFESLELSKQIPSLRKSLEQIYNKVVASSEVMCFPTWLENWIQVCCQEIRRVVPDRESGWAQLQECRLFHIPDMINDKLGITGALKHLLFHLVRQVIV